jgi:tripartite-type tricarboxylate transporter receptor subunit TctC
MLARRTGLAALVGSLSAGPLAPSARGQERFPDRPPRLVVPYAAGTATDLAARQLAGVLGDALGHLPVVENRSGAGGIVGTEAVARSTGDGYTLLFAGSQTHAINVSLYRRLPYDPVADFTPIARLATQPMVLVVPSQLPARSVSELVALAKSRPGQINYASSGIGTTAHLTGSALRVQAGIDITHVPYGSAALIFAGLFNGDTSMMFYPWQPLKPHVEAGRLRVLATCGEGRLPWLPDAPTMIESGFDNFVAASWFGIFGPAGVPEERVNTLADAIRRTLETPEIVSGFAAAGTQITYMPPGEFRGFIAAEIERYRKVVADSGAKVE